MTKNFSLFAVMWGLIVAISVMLLLFFRITVPITLFPTAFISWPLIHLLPVWMLFALWFVTWISGLLLWND